MLTLLVALMFKSGTGLRRPATLQAQALVTHQLARLAIALEALIIGLDLLAGPRYGCSAAALFLIAASVWTAFGADEHGCACFGSFSRVRSLRHSLWRNTGLILLAAVGALGPNSPGLPGWAVFAGVSIAVAVLLEEASCSVAHPRRLATSHVQ